MLIEYLHKFTQSCLLNFPTVRSKTFFHDLSHFLMFHKNKFSQTLKLKNSPTVFFANLHKNFHLVYVDTCTCLSTSIAGFRCSVCHSLFTMSKLEIRKGGGRGRKIGGRGNHTSIYIVVCFKHHYCYERGNQECQLKKPK